MSKRLDNLRKQQFRNFTHVRIDEFPETDPVARGQRKAADRRRREAQLARAALPVRPPKPESPHKIWHKLVAAGAGVAAVAGFLVITSDDKAPTHLPQPGSPAAVRGIEAGRLEEIVIPKGAVAEKIAKGRQANGDLVAGILNEAEKYNDNHGIDYEGLHKGAPLVVPVREQDKG